MTRRELAKAWSALAYPAPGIIPKAEDFQTKAEQFNALIGHYWKPGLGKMVVGKRDEEFFPVAELTVESVMAKPTWNLYRDWLLALNEKEYLKAPPAHLSYRKLEARGKNKQGEHRLFFTFWDRVVCGWPRTGDAPMVDFGRMVSAKLTRPP